MLSSWPILGPVIVASMVCGAMLHRFIAKRWNDRAITRRREIAALAKRSKRQ